MLKYNSNNITLLFTFFFLGILCLSAQENKVKRANKEYTDFSFIDAREHYLDVVEQGYKSVEVLSKLGDSYYFTADLANAEKWYGALYEYSNDLSAEYLYRYAQSLKSVGKYSTADRIMTKMEEKSSDDNRFQLFSEEQNYLKLIELQSGRFTIESLPFNSDLSDYAPFANGAEIVFSSNRKRRSASKRIHDWNDEPFTELYTVLVGGENNPKRFSGKLNTKFHESSAVFTQDGQTMYFTRNNYTKGKKGKDGNGINHLKLYKASKDKDGQWKEAVELPFNSDRYSVAHPALSPDGKILYFSSDMDGGEGMSDLYKVTIEGDNYGEPESLGNAVNTEGRETFPYVDANGDLYFASDGHVGLGGLDIYVSELDADGNFLSGFNLGKPINSAKDDFGIYINSDTGLGYFSSNREGGMGEDDIYSLQQIKPLIRSCGQSLTGEVREKGSDDLISGAKVVLLDADNNVLEEMISDENGTFQFNVLECATNFAVRASKSGFTIDEKAFKTSGEFEAEIKKTLYLQTEGDQLILSANVGEDLGQILKLNPIYFDLNQSYIRPDAQLELFKIVQALKKFPSMKIDVRSHTDSRSSDEYNLKLSNERAISTMQYIIDSGIDVSRVSGKGYGESRLINRCSNGVPCSEVDHQLNRRSEFIILEK